MSRLPSALHSQKPKGITLFRARSDAIHWMRKRRPKTRLPLNPTIFQGWIKIPNTCVSARNWKLFITRQGSSKEARFTNRRLSFPFVGMQLRLRRMSSIWDLANPQLRNLPVYEPGKPIEETARELGAHPDEIIKLASNENPLGPSPKALSALRSALTSANLYPDGGGFYLREALSAKLGVGRDQIILGAGSNEIIEFFGHALLDRGVEIVTSEHAFVVYKLVAAVFGARTIEVPSPDLRHDLGGILAAITPKTRLV